MSAQVRSHLETLNLYLQEEIGEQSDRKFSDLEECDDDDKENKEYNKFVNELKRFDPVAADITYLEEVSEEIQAAKEEIDNVFNEERKNKIISKVEKLLKRSRAKSRKLKEAMIDKGGLKDKIEAINAEEKETGTVKSQIRLNMYHFYMKKYYEANKTYSSLANNFKAKVRNRAKRDLKFISEDMTDEQADDLIDKGMDQQYIQSRLDGDQQELQRLMAQADEVAQINRGVKEILTMFQEMATLVDAQQETIDNITAHVASAKEYTGEAVVELQKAAEYNLAARKKMCICATLALLVVGVIIIVILSTTGVFDKK
eukprot:jgi/Bigna1/71424/fgenesh1_pg.15_\